MPRITHDEYQAVYEQLREHLHYITRLRNRIETRRADCPAGVLVAVREAHKSIYQLRLSIRYAGMDAKRGKMEPPDLPLPKDYVPKPVTGFRNGMP